MLWDVASALVRSVVFIGRLCSEAHALSSNLTSVFDTEAAPVLRLLDGAKQMKDAHGELKTSFDGVADSIRTAKDAKERLFLANRAECTEIAERVALIQGTIDTLKAQYESKAKASGSNTTSASSSSSAAAASSLPSDVQSHHDSLVAALSAVAVLLSSQVMPAKKKSWLKKQQWILKQANKRDETRAAFAAHAAKIGAAMDGLGLALQVQLNGAVMQMSADSAVNSAAALTRSDLLEWQQMHAADIEAERATWDQTQRDEIAVGFNGLLQQLEESAQRQAEAMKAGFDAAAKIAQSSGKKLDHAAHQMNDANDKLDALTAMMQSMQMQMAIVAAGPASPVSPSSAERPQWKYSFLELSLADLRIDFDDDRCCVGEGAMGEVWIGEWTPNLMARGGAGSGSGLGSWVGPSSPQHGQPLSIAFKMLRLPRGTSDARRMELIRQLKREGSLMWLLNGHPNTVQLYGAVTEGRRIGLAFELCNTGTLQSHLYAIGTDEQTGLSSYRPVSGAAALSAAQQLSAVSSLMQAIGFAHAKGVVHRDIKSENVLMHDFHRSQETRAAACQAASSQSASSSASPSSTPLLSFKLSDFGSARALGQFAGLSAFASSMGGVGQSGGTLRWTPPELLSAQWHELSAEDQRAAENSFAVDIYALGLVIGEIFLCQPPFAQLGPQCKDLQLRDAIVAAATAPFDWSKIEAVAPKLAQLIQTCCHRIPNKRPTIAELSFGLWPEAMQQILSRAPGTAAQPIVAASAATVAPFPVPLSDATRAQIQSALSVLRGPSSDDRSLEKACDEIRSLTTDAAGRTVRDRNLASSLLDLGAVDLLVRILHRRLDGAALFTAASFVLRRIIWLDDVARAVLAVDGLPSALFAAAEMYPLEATLISNVCVILGRMHEVDSARMHALVPRTAQLSVHAMRDHAADATVVWFACDSCTKLIHKANLPVLTEAGVLNALLHAAEQYSEKVDIVKRVCVAIVSFAALDEETALRMLDPSSAVLRVLQAALVTYAASAFVTSRVCESFERLSKHKAAQLVLRQSGVVACLLSSLRAHPTIVDVVVCVCDTIANLNTEDSSVIAAVLSAMDQHMQNASVVAAACRALGVLSLCAANQPTLLDAGMIPRVIRCLQLHSVDWKVSEAACRALAGITWKSSRARSVVDSQSPSVYELLLHVLSVHAKVPGVVAAMVDLLSNVHRESVQPNVVALIRLGAIEQLAQLHTLYSTRPTIEPYLANLIAILERERGKAH